MVRINYITNIGRDEASGGWSGINAAVYENLKRHFEVNYVGPINRGVDYPAKFVSKLRRLSGRPGSFHFFSERRLNAIAAEVWSRVDAGSDCDFFHGPTSWINSNPSRPYFVYTDTCFANYVDVYHDRTLFIEEDLRRICDAEARFLRRASRVFFGTQWALERAAEDYSLLTSNMRVVGAGGHVPIPAADRYRGGTNFLFVAHDFEQKGGLACVEAFETVRRSFPSAGLTILGARPPREVLGKAGVRYAGFLRKTVPSELKLLLDTFAEAFALVHPTSSDINPLTIIEAGYFGCPVIAPKSFGIPELVRDGETGLLIEPPVSAEAFAKGMLGLCLDSEKYLSMRHSARAHTTANLTWKAVGERIASEMLEALAESGTARRSTGLRTATVH